MKMLHLRICQSTRLRFVIIQFKKILGNGQKIIIWGCFCTDIDLHSTVFIQEQGTGNLKDFWNHFCFEISEIFSNLL
jgi:hypothetical protein